MAKTDNRAKRAAPKVLAVMLRGLRKFNDLTYTGKKSMRLDTPKLTKGIVTSASGTDKWRPWSATIFTNSPPTVIADRLWNRHQVPKQMIYLTKILVQNSRCPNAAGTRKQQTPIEEVKSKLIVCTLLIHAFLELDLWRQKQEQWTYLQRGIRYK